MDPAATARAVDVALVARLAAGDRSAPAELYDRYGRMVFALAVRVTGDRAVAEEVVQDVFVTACTRHHLFDATRGGLATWLLAIARNRALDRLRTEQRHRATPVAVAADAATAPRSEPGPEGRMLDEERGAAVRRALHRVPPRQREAIELMYFAGLDQQAVAERLEIPVGTVKSRVFHGLQRLRDALGEEVEG